MKGLAEVWACRRRALVQRILIITTLFAGELKSAPLASDLAAAFRASGASVDVVVVNWSEQGGRLDKGERRYSEGGIKVKVINPIPVTHIPRLFRKPIRRVLTLLKSYMITVSFVRNRNYDVIFCFTIASSLISAFLAARCHAKTSILYITDFFPDHNIEIGTMSPGLIEKVARAFERWSYRKFEHLAVMADDGREYLRKILQDPQLEVKTIPLWTSATPLFASDREAIRLAHNLPSKTVIAVFGGYIAQGRGIEEIVDVAKRASREKTDLLILFVGDGPLMHLVQKGVEEYSSHLRHIGSVDHAAYLELLTACDIGLVATTGGVTAPAFPSKTLDYLRSGLPLVASTDLASAYAQMIHRAEIGFATQAGSSSSLFASLIRLARDSELRARMSANGRRVFSEQFSALGAVGRISRIADTSLQSETRTPGTASQ